jgi:hypothetical protein
LRENAAMFSLALKVKMSGYFGSYIFRAGLAAFDNGIEVAAVNFLLPGQMTLRTPPRLIQQIGQRCIKMIRN